MAFEKPKYRRRRVDEAGDILRDYPSPRDPDSFNEYSDAHDVLANWRSCHAYPLNTFQATLRNKLHGIDDNAIIAQRLKRTPSIITKLNRQKHMRLSQMQDIGGLRAVVNTTALAYRLKDSYDSSQFKHKLHSWNDYINTPKNDGYRSIHLIFKYNNPRAVEYKDLLVELQIRSKLQHAWATAVETMSVFLRQALKNGGGSAEWREFFSAASAALSLVENTPRTPKYNNMTDNDVIKIVADYNKKLDVLSKLQSFAVAANMITKSKGTGAFHLIVLNQTTKSVQITAYSRENLSQANSDYAKIELENQKLNCLDAVLVSAGPVAMLQRAYPNYFLDTQEFVTSIGSLIKGI